MTKGDIEFNTTVTLREYFESKLEALSKAVEVAKISMDARMQTTNEWRGALDDYVKTLFTRAEHYAWKDHVDSQFISLHNTTTELKGSILVTVTKDELITKLEPICKDIQDLKDFKLVVDTKATTKQLLYAYVVGGVSLLISLISLIMMIADKMYGK